MRRTLSYSEYLDWLAFAREFPLPYDMAGYLGAEILAAIRNQGAFSAPLVHDLEEFPPGLAPKRYVRAFDVAPWLAPREAPAKTATRRKAPAKPVDAEAAKRAEIQADADHWYVALRAHGVKPLPDPAPKQ